jgi:hypothetical protein
MVLAVAVSEMIVHQLANCELFCVHLTIVCCITQLVHLMIESVGQGSMFTNTGL